MGFFNKVILLGNVTKNPDIRHIPGSGASVARFGLAVNRRYKGSDGVKDEACFVDIVAFSKLAEIAGEYIAKGMPVLVEGRLAFRTWEQDGIKRSKHEIVAENIQFIQRKEFSSANDEMRNAQEYDAEGDTSGHMTENDIPF